MDQPPQELEVTFEIGGRKHAHRFRKGPVTIGRKNTCDIVVVDPSVSRLHATLSDESGQWILRDSGSVNGIEVEGRLVKAHTLRGVERIYLGNVPVQTRVAGGVEVSADPGTQIIDMTSSIEVSDFGTLIESSLRDVLPDAGSDTEAGNETGRIKKPISTISEVESRKTLQPATIITIVKDATDALLAHDSLDELLERLLDLAFEHLPIRRAYILMVDPETGDLRPQVQRVVGEDDTGTMRISRHIANEAVVSKKAVLVVDAGSDARFEAAASVVDFGIRSAMCAPLHYEGKVLGLIYVDRRARNVFSRAHLEILSILGSLSAAAVERGRLRKSIAEERRIRERLTRYNAPEVIDHIMKVDEAAEGMAVEEREVTVLFADIAGFTQLSEDLPAREVTAILNETFEALTQVVFAGGGTLDKFMGDAVMVFFGAPLEQPDHAMRAVRTALAMQKCVDELNASRHADGQLNGRAQPKLEIRIGINTGNAVVGDIGAKQRRDYTVIGDTVNTACRIESTVAKKGQVVIGPKTYQQVADMFECQELEPVVLRGKSIAITPHLVLHEVGVPQG